MLESQKPWDTNFNPRSLTGATAAQVEMHKAARISIHAPSRERLNSAGSVNPAAAFQSTLPRGSDTPCWLSKSKVSYFNPRSLTGATNDDQTITQTTTISIHAPLRERQGYCCKKCFDDWFSIHAQLSRAACCRSDFNPRSLAGATPMRQRYRLILLFQSTLPRGSDYGFNTVGAVTFISIHAPLRKRRLSPWDAAAGLPFQSTLPYGSDIQLNPSAFPVRPFQSTLPCGSDRCNP